MQTSTRFRAATSTCGLPMAATAVAHLRRRVVVQFKESIATDAPATKAAMTQDKGKPATYSGGYAVCAKGEALTPWGHELPALLPNEVDIKVIHNGVCHSDIHMRDDDWFISKFPFIPGHEVVGEVMALGSAVSLLQLGQRVGVAWIRNSCRRCAPCLRGEENICEPGYEGTIVGGNHGGFQSVIRVPADFAFTIPDGLDSASAAPLLCAGVTVFAPLKKWLTRPGMEVAILGVGGLGHLAVQFASAMGGVVTAIDMAADKEAECVELGASKFMAMGPNTPEKLKGTVDLILNCASGAVATGPLLAMLKNDGVLVQVGIPGNRAQITLPLTDLVFGQKKVAGSIVGGRSDMASMFALAAAKNIKPMIEIMPSTQFNEALARVQAGKARYRVVVDMQAVEDPALVLKT